MSTWNGCSMRETLSSLLLHTSGGLGKKKKKFIFKIETFKTYLKWKHILKKWKEIETYFKMEIYFKVMETNNKND